jgi:hypothetical protein
MAKGQAYHALIAAGVEPDAVRATCRDLNDLLRVLPPVDVRQHRNPGIRHSWAQQAALAQALGFVWAMHFQNGQKESA